MAIDQASILITGAGGQLGIALRAQYPDAIAVNSQELDIQDSKQLAGYDWASIHTIINAAAYTDVDGAETAAGRRAAWAINAQGAANLADIAIKRNMTLVHISTDYVFDGVGAQHDESESYSPLGVYGQTKAAADIIISLLPKHYIMRTSWLIGDGKNFVKTMLGLGAKGIAPTVVNDQIGRLTFTNELVRAIDHALNQQIPFGIYNISNSGSSESWATITREIFAIAGYSLDVANTSTADYYKDKSGVAPRPLQSTLALDKLQATGFESTDWPAALKQYISKEEPT